MNVEDAEGKGRGLFEVYYIPVFAWRDSAETKPQLG
jgi:hypothetical protein